MKNKEYYGVPYLIRYNSVISDDETRVQSRFLDSVMKQAPNTLLLDFCCGTGRHMPHLSEVGFFVVGADINKESISLAKKALRKNTRVSFLNADLSKTQIPCMFGGAYSLYTSIGTASKKINRTMFSNLLNAIVPDGVAVIDTINPGLPYQKYQKEKFAVFQGKKYEIQHSPCQMI